MIEERSPPTDRQNLLADAVRYHQAGHLAEAERRYRQILQSDCGHADALHLLGVIAHQVGRKDVAVGLIGRAIAVQGREAIYHSNLGLALKDLARPDQAVAAFRAALCLKPDYAEAHSNLGNSLYQLGRFEAAIAAYQAALRIKPDYAEAHHNLGNAFLLTGRFQEGWSEYEGRWNRKDYASLRRNFLQPLWRGENLAGKTILLHAEQGIGDALQFCRYAPLVAAQGGRVILEIHRPLIRLLRGLAGVERIIAKGDPLPPFDLHCPLMSLPRVFDTRIDSIPAVIPYLTAAADRVAFWRDRLPRSAIRVGIAWQGSPTYTHDRTRSVPLACFAPLAKIAGVRLISLQKRHGLEQLNHLPADMKVDSLENFDEGEDAFIDTAAVMMGLDLIVTVDTAIAHLAGALGRPVWVSLANSPHWVWMLDRDDTPWYPTMRLFRQKSPGQWQDVFERVAVTLAEGGSSSQT